MDIKDIFKEVITKLPTPDNYPGDRITIPFIEDVNVSIHKTIIPNPNSEPYKIFIFQKSICGTYWIPVSKEFDNFQTELMNIFNN